MAAFANAYNINSPVNVYGGLYVDKDTSPVTSKVDLGQLITYNFVIESASTLPTSGNEVGRIMYNTTLQKIAWWDGSVWVYPDTGSFITSIADTNTINLTLASSVLTADIIVDPAGPVTSNTNGVTLKTKSAITMPLITSDNYGLVISGAKLDISNKTYTSVESNLDVENKKITALADPTADQDAVNLRSLRNYAQGFKFKEPVDTVYNGDVYNAVTNPPGSIDGITIIVGERYLFANPTTETRYNGIYSWNGTSFARTLDADTEAEIPGAFVICKRGITNADTIWLCTTDNITTLNTDSIIFSKLPIQAYTAGDAIDIVANDISVKVDDETIEITGDELAVIPDPSKALDKSINGLFVKVDQSSIGYNDLGYLETITRRIYRGYDNYTTVSNNYQSLTINAYYLTTQQGYANPDGTKILINNVRLVYVAGSRFPLGTILECNQNHTYSTTTNKYSLNWWANENESFDIWYEIYYDPNW